MPCSCFITALISVLGCAGTHPSVRELKNTWNVAKVGLGIINQEDVSPKGREAAHSFTEVTE